MGEGMRMILSEIANELQAHPEMLEGNEELTTLIAQVLGTALVLEAFQGEPEKPLIGPKLDHSAMVGAYVLGYARGAGYSSWRALWGEEER